MKLGTAVILDDNYEIRVVVTNVPDDMPYGDIYTDIDDLKSAHPNDDWMFGFVIVDRETGLIPDEKYAFAEFYETIEDAMCDYADIIVKNRFCEPFNGMIN